MDFITEDDLRTQYKAQPFTEFRIPEKTRLTSSARQFLSDRKISVFENGIVLNRGIPVQERRIGERGTAKQQIPKLKNQLEILEAEVLLFASEIVTDNLHMAQQILNIGRALSSLQSHFSVDGKRVVGQLNGCKDINEERCAKEQGNCFEVTDIYIQAPNGRLILTLNYLRSRVREIRILASEVLCETEQVTVIEAETDAIVNKISQLICTLTGEKECKKQSNKEE